MSNLLSRKRAAQLLITLNCSLYNPLFADEVRELPQQSLSPTALPSDSKIAAETTDSTQANSTSTLQNTEQNIVVDQENEQTANSSTPDTTEPSKTIPNTSALIQESSISEIRDGGKILVMDNGMSFEVPTVLKKRCAEWQPKDKIFIEKGRRTNWYKIINTTRNEKVRVRIQTQSDVK